MILSDDFYTGVLDTSLWEVVDPQGDGTVELVGAGTSDAQLLLSVPAGTTHDAWSTNTTLRVMQPAADEDFEIEVKFESEPTQGYQSQGLLVEQDASNYVRFDVYSDGSSLRAFAATFANGAPTIRVNSPIPSGPTTYLRLGRSGNQWTARYSYDGVSWTTAASFSHALTVWSVGVFSGNFTPNPAYTAVVDYFFDTSAPVDPEDGPICDPSDQFTVTVASNGPGAVTVDPDLSNYSCGELLTLTAEPDSGAAFLGWGAPLNVTTNPLVLTVGSDTSVTANFELDSSPPQISNVNVAVGVTSATVSWQTNELTTGFVEYGLTPSYGLGSIASDTSSTTHAVSLPGLVEGEVYHYRITAEDGAGNSSTTSGATFTATAGGPQIDVWYGDSQSFGALGNPQVFVNVLGQVSDSDGVSTLTYSLNAGPPQSLSFQPFRRLSEPGDFNVEIDYQYLSAGTNTIEIRAVDSLGFESIKTITVDYTAGNTWPLGYQVDWSTANAISDVAQVVDGRWSIVGGELRNDLQNYDRLVAIGDLAWTDYEVTVPVTVREIDPAGFRGHQRRTRCRRVPQVDWSFRLGWITAQVGILPDGRRRLDSLRGGRKRDRSIDGFHTGRPLPTRSSESGFRVGDEVHLQGSRRNSTRRKRALQHQGVGRWLARARCLGAGKCRHRRHRRWCSTVHRSLRRRKLWQRSDRTALESVALRGLEVALDACAPPSVLPGHSLQIRESDFDPLC